MTLKHPEILSNSPYYDDFNEAKKFLRVLFKPGYSIQARELTQLQTIMQSQLSRFADHIFVDGSQVFGGKVFVDKTNYVRVEAFTSDVNGNLSSTSTEDYLASILIPEEDITVSNNYESNRITGTVEKTELEIYKWTGSAYETTSSGTILLNHFIGSLENGVDDYPVLFFADITGNDGIEPQYLLKIKGQNIWFKVITQSQTSDGVYPISPTGSAVLVKVDAGIYYVDGLFVKNDAQILVPYDVSIDGQIEESYESGLYNYTKDDTSPIDGGVRLFSAPTARVGLYLNRTVVTSDDDATLRDPSSGFYNENAPGADRYVIDLQLQQYPYDPQDIGVDNYANQDFIQVARIVRGRADWIRLLPNYSQILDLFARRTYDESGSYTVRPFGLEVKNHLRDDLYVYEVETSSDNPDDPQYLDIGGYLWVGDIGDPTATETQDYDLLAVGVGEIVNVIPYKEIAVGTANQTADSSSKLVYVRMLNNKRLAIGTTFTSVNYKRSSAFSEVTVPARFNKFSVDRTGTYSVFDIPQGDSTLLNLAIQPGKAYVFGYETDLSNVKNVDYDKGVNVLENTKTKFVNLNSESILGNYLVCSFDSDTKEAIPEWERLPKFELQTSDIMTLVFEQSGLEQKSSEIYHWAPYKEWTSNSTDYMTGLPAEYPQEKYESVLFVENTGAADELNSNIFDIDDVDTVDACNGRQNPYNNVGGSNTQTAYEMRLISGPLSSVVRAEFLQQAIEGDFPQAYDPTISVTADPLGFTDNFSTDSNYEIKQLNKDGSVTGTGKSLRWVSSTSYDNEASLFLTKQSTSDFVSPYSGSAFNQATAPDAGVLFNESTGVSWGSSVKAVMEISNIWYLDLTSLSGQIVSATGSLTAINILATSFDGYIFRVEEINGGIRVYVHLNSSPTSTATLVDKVLASQEYSGDVPCFTYTITSATRVDADDAIRFLRIEFNDSATSKTAFNNSASTDPQRDVYQYRWDAITNETADQSLGVFYAWVAEQKALYIKECDVNEPFDTKYGPVYQGDAVWGNEGFTRNTDFEVKTGRFVNIKHTATNNYSEEKEFQVGEDLVQTLSREVSYNSSYNYLPGEKIFQIQEPDPSTDELDDAIPYQYSSATVISWTYPDVNNPTDTSPMVLVARIDRYGPEQPGSYGATTAAYQELNTFQVGDGIASFGFGGKIVPYRVLLTNPTAWPYETNNSSTVYFTDNKEVRANRETTPLDSTIGTTRIRAVTPYSGVAEGETGPFFKFFIFDTQLTEPDSSFANVSSLIYSATNANETVKKKVASIAPYSGKRLRRETFPGTNQTIDVYDTVIFEPGKDKNIFKVPFGNVFSNVLQDDSLSIEIQKIYTEQFGDTDTSITIQTDNPNATFLSSDANINWFVVDTDTGEKLTLVNDQVPGTGQLKYSISEDLQDLTLERQTGTEPLRITIFTKQSVVFTQNSVKVKKLSSKKEVINGLTLETKGKHKGKYTAQLDPESIIKNIKSIYAVNSDGALVTGTDRLDEYFKVDLGITDQKISKPKIVLNPGLSNPDGTIKGNIFNAGEANVDPASISLEVVYDAYDCATLTSSGLFVKESFQDANNDQLSMDEIPFYVSPNDGKVYHESSIIDFRPNSLQLTDDFFLDAKFVPHPDWSDDIEVQYYLPRRDKLVLNAKGNFEVLYGVPSEVPSYPQDKPQAMTLYLLDKPSYVFNPNEVKTKMMENRRYTMRDIGKIDSRVKKLEYYTSLSLLEQSAENMLVLDANGNNRFKSGILVDTFNGHKIGDVVHQDYNIAMDFNAGYARPPFETNTTKLEEIPNAQAENSKFKNVIDNGYLSETQQSKVRDNIFMFPFTREVFVAQPLATRSITLQPHEVVVFEGQASINPPIDNWVDQETRPAISVNLAGENDAWEMMVAALNNNNLAPFGTQWSEWETLSRIGISVDTTTETFTNVLVPMPSEPHAWGSALREITTLTTTTLTELLNQERTSFINTLSTSTNNISLGERIVDVSIQPFMRENILRVWATGLKPTSRMYVFFDGVNVAEYCTKHTSIESLFGETTATTYNFSTADTSDLKTNGNGEAFIEFRLPAGIFRIGDRKFEITDDHRNDKSKASSYASVIYSSSGLRTVSEETIATTRSFEVASATGSTEQRSIEETTILDQTSTSQLQNFDPLAQTFFVDPILHPEGIFLESVDLYFARKPEANIPVHIQVRPVVNGYPDSARIYPGGIVYKQQSEVAVYDTPDPANGATKFTFTRPLHLAPGEHSIVVKSPSSEYEIYIATLGDFLIDTDQRVTNQPYVGVFFTSANASTWSPDQNTDMMMVLNKCMFQTNTVYDMKLRNIETDQDIIYETANLVGSYVDFESCRTQWELISTPVVNNNQSVSVIEPNKNFELTTRSIYSSDKNAQIELSASTTNRDVSPVIDLDAMDLFTIRNLVESDDSISNGETNPYASAVQQGTIARARYISRVVTLQDGFESNNLRCILAINKPAGTNIQVFGKVQDAYSTSEFHDNDYIKMIPNVNNFDDYTTENQFVEVEFSLPEDTASSFNKFCVKICLYSTNSAYVPKVKDLRALAVL